MDKIDSLLATLPSDGGRFQGERNFREQALTASREDGRTLSNVAHALGVPLNHQPRLDDAQALLLRLHAIVLQNIAYATQQMDEAEKNGHTDAWKKWGRWRAAWMPEKTRVELALTGNLIVGKDGRRN